MKKLFMVILLLLSFSNISFAQTNFAIGLSTGIPVGNSGVVGASINTMLSAVVTDEKKAKQNIQKMSIEERKEFIEKRNEQNHFMNEVLLSIIAVAVCFLIYNIFF